jgi:hypothetical protein
MRMPIPSRLGRMSRSEISCRRLSCSAAISFTTASCWAGDRPAESGDWSPSAIAFLRPATRTMKNSSRLLVTMAMNLARSARGVAASSTSSSTRELKDSHDSSRLKKISGSCALRFGLPLGVMRHPPW